MKKGQSGVTLVELVLAIVILAIAVDALYTFYAYITQHSVNPMLTYQATAVAQSYLEEIVSKNFTDPADNPDTGIACPAPNAAGRSSYDNVCDYRGLPDRVVRDQNGNAIASLNNYQVSVVITDNQAWQGIPATDVIRVDVSVIDPRGEVVNLAAYRTRY